MIKKGFYIYSGYCLLVGIALFISLFFANVIEIKSVNFDALISVGRSLFTSPNEITTQFLTSNIYLYFYLFGIATYVFIAYLCIVLLFRLLQRYKPKFNYNRYFRQVDKRIRSSEVISVNKDLKALRKSIEELKDILKKEMEEYEKFQKEAIDDYLS